MQIFNTLVDFPTPAQSGGIFLPKFGRMHFVAPAKANVDRQMDRSMNRQTDYGQSGPYVALFFAGATIIQLFSDKTVKRRFLADT